MVNHKILLLKFKDNFLENVKEYKYLGCMINSNGRLVNSSLDLSKKAKKVLFSIKVSIHLILVRFQLRYVACNPVDTLVKPILAYNSEMSFLKLFRATLCAE